MSTFAKGTCNAGEMMNIDGVTYIAQQSSSSESHVFKNELCKQCTLLDTRPQSALRDPKSVCMYCSDERHKRKHKHNRTMSCARCLVVRYCSKKCQTADYKHHRQVCKCLSSAQEGEEIGSKHLSNVPLRMSEGVGIHINMFRNSLGQFWESDMSQKYLHFLLLRTEYIEYLIYEQGMATLMGMLIGYRLELLRLDRCDNLKQRLKLPFDLLNKNRDDDCFAFIKYWLWCLFCSSYNEKEPGYVYPTRDKISLTPRDVSLLCAKIDCSHQIPSSDPPSEEFDLHENTLKGDWIYPLPEADDKLNDPIKTLRLNGKNVPLPFLIALLLLKLRIIVTHEVSVSQPKTAKETTCGHGDKETGRAEDYAKFCLKDGEVNRQEEMVERYIRMIHKKNPAFFRAVLEPQIVQSPIPEVDYRHVADIVWLLPFCRFPLLRYRRILPLIEQCLDCDIAVITQTLVPCSAPEIELRNGVMFPSNSTNSWRFQRD